jgi:hypothetical protein
MSEIPSDIASSAAGAPIQARQVAKEREAGRAGQVHAAERQIKSVGEADTIVDTEDADTQVFSDSEGGGSLGRDLSDEKGDSATDPPSPQPGITTGDDGQTHLDLQA